METNKSHQMESFLENMGQQLFGRSREVSSDNQLCISCGADANHFRDEISRKEYGILDGLDNEPTFCVTSLTVILITKKI